MQKINFVRLKNAPIFWQLQLEEALLKADKDNWCIINEGTPSAIVMGISGKPELLLHPEHFYREKLVLIKRFTGGGTVVVDEGTLFATFIINSTVMDVPAYPESVMKWSETFYQPIFEEHPFRRCENDYVMNDLKFGGNAQYMKKQRWLHHSSLLWDYDPRKMNVLRLPPKMPVYRASRPHEEFLCRLKDFFPSQENFIELFERRLASLFSIQHVSLKALEPLLQLPHHKSTQQMDLMDKVDRQMDFMEKSNSSSVSKKGK